jgi:hypothetical protein
MSKQIAVDLFDPKSIRKATRYLEKEKSSLQEKCIRFANLLADKGIRVAAMNAGTAFASYIIFSKEIIDSDQNGCKAIMYGKNTQAVFGEGVNASEISPILFVEYGAGINNALPPQVVDGIEVGAGTFPGQQYALDPNGWYYMDNEGVWHHSDGYAPHAPMQKAYDEMVKQQEKIANRIFKI